MGYLVDTHAFLWLAEDDQKLTPRVCTLLDDPNELVFLSVASVWEIAIKISVGKLVLRTSLEQIVQGGVEGGSDYSVSTAIMRISSNSCRTITVIRSIDYLSHKLHTKGFSSSAQIRHSMPMA